MMTSRIINKVWRILGLALLVSTFSTSAAWAQHERWMSRLSDSTPMSHLCLPGTHDSAAQHGGVMLQTQTSSIAHQLKAGIRAFDIRLREHEGELGLYHSTAFQECTWESDVLPAFIAFLKENPTEALVVSLKKEGGSDEAYRCLLSQSLTQPEHTPYYIEHFDADTTLGYCRGKILFLHRDEVMTNYPGCRCEGWADNATCILTLRNADQTTTSLILQDEYEYTSAEEGAPRKLESILKSLRLMHKADANQSPDGYSCGISFISATALPKGFPIQFAEKLNGQVAQTIKKEHLKPKGILFIDFVASKGGKRLVKELIDCNN